MIAQKGTSLEKELVIACIQDTSRRKVILDLCKTRWSMRQEAYNHFCGSFIFIVKALEVIAYDLHKDETSDIFKDDWNPSSKTRALQ